MARPVLVDSHCHLDFESFDDDRDLVVDRAQEYGVGVIIVPAIDIESGEKVLELADRYPMIYAAIGVHPNSSAGWIEEQLDELRELAHHEKVVAIGEIGLDYYRDWSPPEVQRSCLRAQLRLADELALPVIIHNRNADDDLLEILSGYSRPRPGSAGVLHSFSSTIDVAERAIQLGYYIGFTGPITFKKSEELRDVAAKLPLDRILVETDAPFLTPQPYRGKRNEPAFVRFVAEQLATVSGKSLAEIAETTSENAIRLFGLEGRVSRTY